MQPNLPLTVAEWPRNSRETLRVTLDRYNGQVVIDCRAGWRDAAGDLRPGRAGLTLSIKHLPTLHEALAEALAKAPEAQPVSPRGQYRRPRKKIAGNCPSHGTARSIPGCPAVPPQVHI